MQGCRTALASALCLLSITACGTPRDRDCRVLLPRLEEAYRTTDVAANSQPDLTRVYAMQAARSAAAARWLGSASLETDDIRRGVPPLTAALTHQADAAKRADAAIGALGFHAADGGLGALPALSKLFAAESREQSPYLADAITLNDRCGFFLAETKADFPECAELARVLARFLEPQEGVAASAHVADRLAELAAVHSADRRVESALRSLHPIFRDIANGLLATTEDGLATDLVAQLRALLAASTEQRHAAWEVVEAVTAVRVACVAPR